MLVFHGTGGDRDLVEKIFDEGLVPQSHAWAHDTTGIASHVFACTTPIGTRGGDPIQFAQRRAYRDGRAWLFVLDVPPGLVRGAVPNGELEQYWHVRSFASSAFGPSAYNTRALLAAKRERRCAARELLEYRVVSTAKDLCEGQPDADTLVQFEQAYIRVSSRKDKQRVAASYGLRIPTSFADDSHYPWCMGCMHNLFEVQIVAPSVPNVDPFHRGAWTRLDLITFGAHLDALDRWLAAHGDAAFSSFTTFEALQKRYPPPRDQVPRTMWPDFVTADLDARMRLPDTQLLLDHVSTVHIVGAIDIGTRSRLSDLVRPRDGETLIHKLTYLSRELVELRESTGRPVVLAD